MNNNRILKDLLLITPPFTQLNTPYPGTAYLKGFLNTKNISAFQMDLGIEVILEIFSGKGLKKLFSFAQQNESPSSENASRILSCKDHYIENIDEVILFLQGKNQTLARKICSEEYLVQAGRFQQLGDIEWAFGNMGIQDKAKYLATLYIEDLSDFIKERVDPHFGFSRYAEKLGMSANSFDELYSELNGPDTYIDQISQVILEDKLKKVQAKLICFSVPFPGNLYSAFKSAQHIKRILPDVKIAMGGGFPNTELRSLKDERVFEFFDYISLDDGELPIELIHSNVIHPDPANPDYNFLKRTYQLQDGKVVYNNFSLRQDYKQADLGTPDYSDLLLDQYISVIEMANPMHSLWSDGRWLKLTMAHGCYWGKCTFCDISLDYIKNYEPLTASLLVDRMEELIKQTGERGFHFVDEAAPPALMRELALEIIRRKLQVSWWTNIRFEKRFTSDLCRLLQASGCIAVSGGLEVASNRLLELIDKGVTVEQVAQVSQNFTTSGIMVHAYLMYAFPSQSIQETIDSLEMVRQMFELGIQQSGFWHQFAMTAHSPVGKQPHKFAVKAVENEITFANNDVEFEDETGIDHNQFSYGLKKSLYNYMHGIGFEFALQDWFDFEIPNTQVAPDFIEHALQETKPASFKKESKVIWLSSPAQHNLIDEQMQIVLHSKTDSLEIWLDQDQGQWLVDLLHELAVENPNVKSLEFVKDYYENKYEDFSTFWESEQMHMLREFGLVIV